MQQLQEFEQQFVPKKKEKVSLLNRNPFTNGKKDEKDKPPKDTKPASNTNNSNNGPSVPSPKNDSSPACRQQ